MRTVAAVVAGYVTLFMLTAITFSILFLATGRGFAWDPGTTRASMQWMAVAVILGAIAAFAGGWVAGRIGRSFRAVVSLAVLVVILGIVSAVMMSGATRELPSGRTIDSLTVMEAAQYTTQPDWYNYFVPFIAAGAALLGGYLATRQRRARAPLSA